LADLPTLGGQKKAVKNPLDFDLDDLQDSGRLKNENDHSGNKFNSYERQLKDFDKEEKEGYKLKVGLNNKSKKKEEEMGWGFDEDDMIEEDIPSDRDDDNHDKGLHLLESGGGGGG